MTLIDARTSPDFEPRFAIEIEEGQRLRGWITNSYAQIEFMLGDLILRSQEMPEYAHLPTTLPHGAPKRVKRVKQILTAPGPLAEFSEQLGKLLSRFESEHETRNLLAHGFCEFLFTPEGDTGLQFQKWHYAAGREDARLIRCFRLADLEAEKARFIGMSQDAMRLFKTIHDRFSWTGRPDQ